MKNSELKVGSHITICGNKGIVEKVTKCKEYEYSYKDHVIGTSVFTDEAVKVMEEKGYTLVYTGRTATYFDVDFSNDSRVKGTPYDHGCYGCVDEYENYGTWE